MGRFVSWWSASALLVGLVSTGCRSAVQELGHEGLGSPAAADAVAGAIASRFGPIELDPALRAARPKFARDSLSPSRLVDDAALWTRSDGPWRALEFGARGGLPYRVGIRPPAASPVEAGAYRGTIRLEALGSGEFEWWVRDELSIGRVRVEQLSRAAGALLGDLEERSEVDVRALARRNLPRASAAFGRLVTLERLSLAPANDGGVAVTITIRLTPSAIRTGFPQYARFLEEYMAPARFGLTVADTNDVPFWDLVAHDNQAALRFRVHAGSLAALVGRPRALPDRLRATSEISLKSGLFRVGVERLVAEVALVRVPGEKSFRARFNREPSWQLPFLVKPLLRSPLRRPFQGEGALFALAIRDSAEGSTRVEREYRLVVRESWVIRWLGSFGGGMATVFRAGAEAEADRFAGECLWALRDDLVAMVS